MNAVHRFSPRIQLNPYCGRQRSRRRLTQFCMTATSEDIRTPAILLRNMVRRQSPPRHASSHSFSLKHYTPLVVNSKRLEGTADRPPEVSLYAQEMVLLSEAELLGIFLESFVTGELATRISIHFNFCTCVDVGGFEPLGAQPRLLTIRPAGIFFTLACVSIFAQNGRRSSSWGYSVLVVCFMFTIAMTVCSSPRCIFSALKNFGQT